MNRDELFRMARDAGLAHWDDMVQADAFSFALPKRLERFAASVAAAEREACVSIITREAQAYSEPVWAVEIVNDIRARGKK